MRPLAGGIATGAAAVVMGVLAAVLAFSRMAPESTERGVYDPSAYGLRGPGGCVPPSTPPYFHAMALPAASRAAAESLAARLGLDGTWERDLYVCDVGSGALVWAAGPRTDRDVRIPAGRIVPLAHRDYQPDDPDLPMGRIPQRLPGRQLPPANQVFWLGGPIALVPSVDAVVRRWPPARSEGNDVPLLPFGPWLELRGLGARARQTRDGGPTHVVMMEPTDPDGLAAHWLAERGPGWIGFELTLGDPGGRGFAERIHARDLEPGQSMWLPPSETGGALVLFTTNPPLIP